MVLSPQQYLQQLASLLKVPLGKIKIGEDYVPTCVIGNQPINGIINIITALLTKSKSNLWSSDSLECAEIQQWLEYSIVYAVHVDEPQNLGEVLSVLDEIMSTRTYLVSQKLTAADVMLYYILINTMITISYIDKQKYMHLSRWFDNLQQDALIRQSNKLVDFETNYLS